MYCRMLCSRSTGGDPPRQHAAGLPLCGRFDGWRCCGVEKRRRAEPAALFIGGSGYSGQTDSVYSDCPSGLILTTTAHLMGSPCSSNFMEPVMPSKVVMAAMASRTALRM